MVGKISEILQEVVLGTKEMPNLKEVNTKRGFYNGYTIVVKGRDSDGQVGSWAWGGQWGGGV